jgi:hypothetical protein
VNKHDAGSRRPAGHAQASAPGEIRVLRRYAGCGAGKRARQRSGATELSATDCNSACEGFGELVRSRAIRLVQPQGGHSVSVAV